MDHWRTPYLGLREIPPGLDDFELTTFFSYSSSERRVIDARRQQLHRLAVALHIGFVRMSGRPLDIIERIPKRLWAHIGQQVGIAPPEVAALRSFYTTRPQTLYDHQQLACETLGFRKMSEHQRRYVVRWLRETFAGRTETSSLLPDLKRWFYDHRILLIADRELKHLIASAQRDYETQLAGHLITSYGEERLTKWGKILTEQNDGGISIQSWLWAAPIKQSTRQMGELFKKIEYLRNLGIHERWPLMLNDAAVRQYGRRCANRPPSVSKRINSARRPLEVGSFLRYALCTSTDQLLLMLRRWIQKMANEAGRATKPQYVDAQTKLREFAQAVRTLATDDDLSHQELKDQLCLLADAALVQAKVNRAALARSYLIDKPMQARAILAKVISLPFEADGDHPVIEALALLRKIYANKPPRLPPDAQRINLGSRWKTSIAVEDPKKALAAFEWATLFKLRMSLRNGSIFVSHSFAFRGHAALLISDEEWAASRNTHYGHLKLPQDASAFLRPIREQLQQRIEQLAKAASAGDIRIDDEGIHLEKSPVSPEDLRVAELRRVLYARRGVGQIAEMMLHIDSKVRFSWLLLGREPHHRAELLLVYAGVLALSTSLSAADISRMIPGVSAESVRQMTKRLSDDRKLRAASDAVFQYLHRFPIALHWGKADLASSDMMSLQTPRAIWQARADPRRKTASVGVYTHVHDRWGIFYDQPVLLNQRQVGVAIEGVIRRMVVDDIGQLAVDTHGFTYFGMSFGKLLSLDLCARLADLKSRRLFALRKFSVPDVLNAVVDCTVDDAIIEANYDQLVRVAASARIGQCSAVQALHRFGSDARGQAVYEAGVQLGKLLCSIFLIDYFLNSEFRRELQHALNRGESMHTLQRAIHDGQIPNELAKRDESLMAVSSALSLMSNIVMAWNAEHMQSALEELGNSGEFPKSEDVRRVAPTNVEGINLRGTYDFPVERYAERILPSLSKVSARSVMLAKPG